MSRMPQITAQELVRFLRKQGFKDDRQAGSHLAVRILKNAGFSVDDYLKLQTS